MTATMNAAEEPSDVVASSEKGHAAAADAPSSAVLYTEQPHDVTQNPSAAYDDLRAVGVAYQSMMETQDSRVLHASVRANTTMMVVIQVYQVPDAMKGCPMSAVDLEVPCHCSLGYLKRALCRASGGFLHPHSQRYHVAVTGEPLLGDSNALSLWSIVSGSLLYLTISDCELRTQACFIPQIGMERGMSATMSCPRVSCNAPSRTPAASCVPPLFPPDTVVGAVAGGGGAGCCDDLDGARASRSPQGRGMSGSGGRARRKRSFSTGVEGGGELDVDDGDAAAVVKLGVVCSQSGSATRQRFTEEEILAVVEGVRLYGTSWSRIKTAFAVPLARRTQVNIKDKWRNLQRGLLNNWKDERSSLTDETKQKIRHLSETLVQHAGCSKEGVDFADAELLDDNDADADAVLVPALLSSGC